jgi:tripartite-type tricarboxylate transporter receptor subunit TctC
LKEIFFMMAFCRNVLVGAVWCASSVIAAAQTVPAGDMRFIVPFPPGGTLDILARTIANDLGPALGRTIVVENKPGASGILGAQTVARAQPDGGTIFIASNTLPTLPALKNNLPFDVFKSFAPIVLLGATPTVITLHPSFPPRDFKSFVAAAKAKKDGVNYNSPGIASPPHLAGELLARAADIPLHHVPYRGTQPAVTDLLAGQIPMMMAPLNAVLPYIQDKQLVPIALTDAQRTQYLPDVPTLHELGLNNMPAVSSWFAILTTAGTPPAVVARLNTEITKILKDPKVQKILESQTFEITPAGPEALSKLMHEEAERNAKIVEEAHISAE